MLTPFDTMENPHKDVKRVVGVLRDGTETGEPLGFRVITEEGALGDIGIDVVSIEIIKSLTLLKPVPMFWNGTRYTTEMEQETGILVRDMSYRTAVVRSLQYHIYLLERKYRQENSTNVFELSYEFYHGGKLKRLSGYLQAQDIHHAAGVGKSYIAQTYRVNIFEIGCPYVEPYYGDVQWGAMSPLLAIKLTLEPKWNKA